MVIGANTLTLALVACARGDRSDDAPLASVDTVAPASTSAAASASPSAPAVTAPITDVAVVTAPDRATLVGRRVALTGVKVLAAAGGGAFWLGTSPDRRLFVVRADDTRPDTAARVRAGQTVSVAGTIRPLRADLDTARSAWQLSAADDAMLGRERIYVRADRVDVGGP